VLGHLIAAGTLRAVSARFGIEDGYTTLRVRIKAPEKIDAAHT
jgi:hypothetical protein